MNLVYFTNLENRGKYGSPPPPIELIEQDKMDHKILNTTQRQHSKTTKPISTMTISL